MMAGGSGSWSRRGSGRLRKLRALVRETKKALSEVASILEIDEGVCSSVAELGRAAAAPPALVLLASSSRARSRLLHALLGRALLPPALCRGSRWIRVRYGETVSVQLSLGNSDFELLEELQCTGSDWSTLPLQDVLRKDKTDLTTVLDIELNVLFLKDGLKIIVPPDIDEEPVENMNQLKKKYQDLFTKRELILKNFNPIFLYALDVFGRNLFVEPFCENIYNSSSSEEDVWTTYSMYYMTRHSSDSVEGVASKSNVSVHRSYNAGEPFVFSAENCLDLQQVKELNKNSEVFFILFSNSKDIDESSRTEEKLLDSSAAQKYTTEATESTEENHFCVQDFPESDQDLVSDDVLRPLNRRLRPKPALFDEQIGFMYDLMEQWRLMSNSSPKTDISNNWLILDDEEISRISEPNSVLASFVSNIKLNDQTSDKTDEKQSDDQNNGKSNKGCDNGGNESQKGSSDQNEKSSKGSPHHKGPKKNSDSDRLVSNRQVLVNRLLKFSTDSVQNYVLDYCTRLSEIHIRLLQQFILASFELARELQVVPKKIEYVSMREKQLFESINEKFREGEKKRELVKIMEQLLAEMKTEVDNMDWSVDDQPCHQDLRYLASNSTFYSSHSTTSNRTCDDDVETTAHVAEEAEAYDSYNFDDYEIIHSPYESMQSSRRDCTTEESSDCSQINSIHVENESDLFSVNSSILRFGTRLIDTNANSRCTNKSQISIKQASLDVQRTVLAALSRKIGTRMLQFVDCLKDSYFGTLQRCLESLEASCREELGGRPATEAMRQLLLVARQVDLQSCASFPIFRTLIESLRRLFHRGVTVARIVGMRNGLCFRAGASLGGAEAAAACCVLSPAWRRRLARRSVAALCASRLAKLISLQIVERLSAAHVRYQEALCSLQGALQGRLGHTEEVKIAIRKKHAPGFARLCLESTSMCDLLMYGMPELGREIGRGQYGVVYASKAPWAGRACAVKTVVPADQRHYCELAMEFFYTRSIPEHRHVVRLLGALQSGGAVWLLSERRARDLHAAVRAGLALSARLRVARDALAGLRYLHSLGLLHRDVKLKNVLLDAEDRGALTDLGFLTSRALVCGSVVGTPVHMAPELLAPSSHYGAAVDVYAFGILLWYICAGHVRLPSAFESFQNKEQLWSKVRRGLRPERLPQFTDECWDLMQSCWQAEPSQRALLGDIQPKLEKMHERCLANEQSYSVSHADTISDVSIDTFDC